MQCVTTVNYHVLVNNDRVGPITPLCGLRQGDPHSPYLYIICSEGLTSYIHHHESRGLLHGVRICRGSPSISHLLFADDNFLFCKASVSEVTNLKHVLDIYEAASGQAINYQKSAIAYSRNTEANCRSLINNLLGVAESMGHGKYLGLPSIIGRDKKSIFSFIKDRIWKKIQNWNSRSLSRAGKEVLIKAVAQAIPSYCMGAFLLPTTLGEEIERMMNSFYWGTKKNGGRGINWLRWDKMTVSKDNGGLNFRDLEGFNLAMLGKQ
ncbi:hypothetical protein P8452_76553 [Trifolium repens]|nr:hypothetical protein P8452_76553 [Trifolium repens]